MMFVGSGTELVFVFPTSTGSTGFETRHQNRKPTYMYRSASHNNGWHDSSQYPVGDDNPLNGNMYKPLYFDRGLAIHGANYVPFYPASKGCTRLRVHDMNRLISWLGLGNVTGTIVSTSTLNATVNVQGHWAG
jgi:lipoprotein-anchoring transpeptidase ErfK/SrfK